MVVIWRNPTTCWRRAVAGVAIGLCAIVASADVGAAPALPRAAVTLLWAFPPFPFMPDPIEPEDQPTAAAPAPTQVAPEPEPPPAQPPVTAAPPPALPEVIPGGVPPPSSAPSTPPAPATVPPPAMMGEPGAGQVAASASAPGAPPTRPRLEAGVGMGFSLDGRGVGNAGTIAVPAFEVQVGAGQGPIGIEARLLATQASGRYQMVADRLAVEALVAVRPWAQRHPDDTRWLRRALRSVTFNLGLGVENANLGTQAALRTGTVLAAHADAPLTPPSDASELRVRVSVRRLLAGEGQAGAVIVSDSGLEILGGLVTVF